MAALLLALLTAASARAAHGPTMVIEYDTNRTVFASDAEERWYPASLTKLMTIYLTFEALKRGELKLDARLTASAPAAAQTGTRLGLAAGNTLTAQEAIFATVLRSANDAAVVLAEQLGGSEPAFAARMSERAIGLGMASTVFRNATGLPDPQQWTTASDMAKLARALLRDFSDRYDLFATREMTWQGKRLHNINGLLGSFPGADGLKTGFTCGAGYNIVASAEHAGRRLIAVVLGANSLDARRSEITRLLQSGFAGTLKPTEPAKAVKAAVPAKAAKASAKAAEPAAALVPAVAGGALKPVLPEGCDGDPARPGITTAPAQGWALTVGNAHQERDAKALIEKARKALNGDLQGGRPYIAHRHIGGLPPYRALVVGLDGKKALSTCMQLRRSDVYCIVISPEQLSSPQSLWN